MNTPFQSKPLRQSPVLNQSPSQVGRRMFFRQAAAGIAGYFFLPSRPGESVARAATSTIGTAKNVIFVFLTGAPSHTDTFDLKTGAWTPSFMAPNTYNGLAFPQGLMPGLANTIQDFALVRSLSAHNTAHALAQSWVQMGRNPVAGLNRIAPHIGSVVANELGDPNSVLPAFVSMNPFAGPGNSFLPPDTAPFGMSPNGATLPNSTNGDGQVALDRRLSLAISLDKEMASDPYGPGPDQMAQFRDKARALAYNTSVNNIFNLDAATKTAYGNTGFGNAVATARNLIKSGMGTRYIQIALGSWDHHQNIYQPNSNLQLMSKQFDSAMAQLIADMKKDGTFDSTLIIAMGEFGRTVGPLTQNAGRDHLLQQSAFIAGAKVKGGRAIGATDATGGVVTNPGWSQNRNIWPEDIEATIYSALGIDYTKVIHAPELGRGFYYIPDTDPYTYAPINELF